MVPKSLKPWLEVFGAQTTESSLLPLSSATAMINKTCWLAKTRLEGQGKKQQYRTFLEIVLIQHLGAK